MILESKSNSKKFSFEPKTFIQRCSSQGNDFKTILNKHEVRIDRGGLGSGNLMLIEQI
jgi:hypothetical protein